MKHFIAFILGAATGAGIAWAVAKNRYEQQYQEDKESIEAYYKTKYEPVLEPKTAKVEVHVEPNNERDIGEKNFIQQFSDIIEKNGYRAYSREPRDESVRVNSDKKEPYVIAPEEYGELNEYELLSWTCYTNGVLTDDMDQPIVDPEQFVGSDVLSKFGQYSEDVVHIRNDERRCDYEIVRSLSTYEEMLADEPYKAEV